MAGNINIYVGSQFLANSIDKVFLAYIDPIDISWEIVEKIPTETYINVRESCTQVSEDDHLNWVCRTSEARNSGFVFNIIALFDTNDKLLSYGILTQTQQLDAAGVWNVQISIAWNLDAESAEQLQIVLLPVYRQHTIDTDPSSGTSTSGSGITTTHDFLKNLDALYMEFDVLDGFKQSDTGLICAWNNEEIDLNQYAYGNLVITGDTSPFKDNENVEHFNEDSDFISWIPASDSSRAFLFNGESATTDNLSETLAEEFNTSIRLSKREFMENTRSHFISSQNSAYRTPLQQKGDGSNYIKTGSNFKSESQVAQLTRVSPMKNRPVNTYINDIVGIYITPAMISILVHQGLIEEGEIDELVKAYRDASLYFDPDGGLGFFLPFKRGFILFPFGTKDFTVKVFCYKIGSSYDDLKNGKDFSITPILYKHRNSYFIQYADGNCYIFDDALYNYEKDVNDEDMFYITDKDNEDFIQVGTLTGGAAWSDDFPDYKMAIVDLNNSSNCKKTPQHIDTNNFIMTPHMCMAGVYGEVVEGPYDWRSFESYCNSIISDLETKIMSGETTGIIIEPWNGIIWHLLELWRDETSNIDITSEAGYPIKFNIIGSAATPEQRAALVSEFKSYLKSYVDLYSYYTTTYKYDNGEISGATSNDTEHNLIPEYMQTVDFGITKLLGITSLYNEADTTDIYTGIPGYDVAHLTDDHKGYYPNFGNNFPEICQYYFDDNYDALVSDYVNFESKTITDSFRTMIKGIREAFNEFYKSKPKDAHWMFCDNGILYYYKDETYYYVNVIKYNNIYGNPVFRQVIPIRQVKDLKISYSSGVLTLKFSLIDYTTQTETTSSDQTSIYDLNSSNPYSPIIGQSATNKYNQSWKPDNVTQTRRYFQIQDFYYGFGVLVKTQDISDTNNLPTINPKQVTDGSLDDISTNGVRLVRFQLS